MADPRTEAAALAEKDVVRPGIYKRGDYANKQAGYYSTGDYMKNVGKAGETLRQRGMRKTADEVEAGYKKSKAATAAPKATPKAETKAESSKAKPKASAPAPKAEIKSKPAAGKPTATKSAHRRTKRPAPAMNVGGKGTVTGARGVPAKEPGGKISMEESKVDYPASKSRVSLEDRKAAPAAAAAPAKKRSKLRRAAGSVARGIGKAARYVGRTLKDNDRKRVTK